MAPTTPITITHIGHSCVLLEIGTAPEPARILLDPGNLTPALENLGRVDAVLITHGHPDHVDAGQLHRLRDHGRPRLFGPADVENQLGDIDLAYTAVEPGSFTVAGVPVTAHRGSHQTLYPGIPLPENIGYEIAGRVVAPGDSLAVPARQVDVLLAPLAGPWMKLSEGIDFVRDITPATVVPVHDAGLAPAHRQLHRELLAACTPDNVTVHALAPFEQFTL